MSFTRPWHFRAPTCPLGAHGVRLAFSSRLFLGPSDDFLSLRRARFEIAYDGLVHFPVTQVSIRALSTLPQNSSSCCQFNSLWGTAWLATVPCGTVAWSQLAASGDAPGARSWPSLWKSSLPPSFLFFWPAVEVSLEHAT